MSSSNERGSMTLAIRILVGMVAGIIVGFFLQGSPEIATTYIDIIK